MKNYLQINIIIFSILLSLFACNKHDNSESINQLDSILSASVSFAYSNNNLQTFLDNPTKAYVSGYFYFEDDLAYDIIFGLDIEWLEGVNSPVNLSGADWMAFIGLTREGKVWIPTGIPENINGITNNDNWQILDLNQELLPNQWYKMTIQADFNSLSFISLNVEGNGISQSFDIQNLQLQYPNYMPFDEPSLTFYTFSGRSLNLIEQNSQLTGTEVYFDDIEGGIEVNNNYQIIFQNGFENQSEIWQIPIESEIIPLSSMQENIWHYENNNAKLEFTNSIKRSGNKSLICNADLRL